jgi:hypothetical protein
MMILPFVYKNINFRMSRGCFCCEKTKEQTHSLNILFFIFYKMTESNTISQTSSNPFEFFEPRTWIPLERHQGYEISEREPFLIRKLKRNNQFKLVNQVINKKNGYYYVKLDKNMPLHRVIAEQLIPNPDGLPIAEHTNRDKLDNRLSNIRWVSVSVNCCNKNQIKGVEQLFIDRLPEGYEPFTEYIVRPERKDPKTGETIPADIRKLPNLFMKWEVMYDDDGTQHWIPRFITYDSKHQYRSLKPDKYNQNCHKVRDENRKVCSISTSKLPKPKTNPEELVSY